MATGDHHNGRDSSPTTDWRRQVGDLLPAWFAERLAQEGTRFGVLLGAGQVLIVDRVRNVRAAPGGRVWLDGEMIETPLMSKRDVADAILDRVEALL